MTSCANSNSAGLVLAVNGAEERLQIAIGRESLDDPSDAALLFSQELVVPGRAMQYLAPALDQALASLGAGPGDLAGVACVRGPGGFTGLRLTMATVQGLAKATSAPMAGIDYLPLLAACHPLASGTLWVLTHSRARQVYAQPFGPGPKPLSPPRVYSLEEAATAVARSDAGPITVLGSGLARNRQALAGLIDKAGAQALLLDAGWNHPRPDRLLAACAGAAFSHQSVEPLYLRGSDAEENLDEIARRRGMDPKAARHSLHSLRSTTPE